MRRYGVQWMEHGMSRVCSIGSISRPKSNSIPIKPINQGIRHPRTRIMARANGGMWCSAGLAMTCMPAKMNWLCSSTTMGSQPGGCANRLCSRPSRRPSNETVRGDETALPLLLELERSVPGFSSSCPRRPCPPPPPSVCVQVCVHR